MISVRKTIFYSLLSQTAKATTMTESISRAMISIFSVTLAFIFLQAMVAFLGIALFFVLAAETNMWLAALLTAAAALAFTLTFLALARLFLRRLQPPERKDVSTEMEEALHMAEKKMEAFVRTSPGLALGLAGLAGILCGTDPELRNSLTKLFRNR